VGAWSYKWLVHFLICPWSRVGVACVDKRPSLKTFFIDWTVRFSLPLCCNVCIVPSNWLFIWSTNCCLFYSTLPSFPDFLHVGQAVQRRTFIDKYRDDCLQQNHRYYLDVDFQLFCPSKVTYCTDEGAVWHGGVDQCDRVSIWPIRSSIIYAVKVFWEPCRALCNCRKKENSSRYWS